MRANKQCHEKKLERIPRKDFQKVMAAMITRKYFQKRKARKHYCKGPPEKKDKFHSGFVDPSSCHQKWGGGFLQLRAVRVGHPFLIPKVFKKYFFNVWDIFLIFSLSFLL